MAMTQAMVNHGAIEKSSAEVFEDVVKLRHGDRFDRYLIHQASSNWFYSGRQTKSTICQCPWPGPLTTACGVLGMNFNHIMDWDGAVAQCFDAGLETQP